ncbi:MAG TPA: hypothetical protein VNI02_00120 [Blastocatellia bacterium]|jgi:prefoldin subunit 5|nr:hypothetical protein [Blastocatellia bacterium]
MIDFRNLSEEIARLDKMIESFEAQLNEIRQQREFKMALLRQLQSEKTGPIAMGDSVEQRPDVISK